MSLNETIVEDPALTWFGELGYTVGHGLHLPPREPAAERDSFGDVVPVGRLREATLRQNPAARYRTFAPFRMALLPKLPSRQVNAAGVESRRETPTPP